MKFLKELFRLVFTVFISVALAYVVLTFFAGCTLLEKHALNFKEDVKLEAAKTLLDTEEKIEKVKKDMNKYVPFHCPGTLTDLECEELRRYHKNL